MDIAIARVEMNVVLLEFCPFQVKVREQAQVRARVRGPADLLLPTESDLKLKLANQIFRVRKVTVLMGETYNESRRRWS